MKKIILASFVLFFVLSGCSAQKQLMDKPATDNNYHYQNADLGFSLILPPEFIYYQTQRKVINGATELAIFTPTADTLYQQEVAGYAKPISVMIYTYGDWGKLSEQNKVGLNKIGEKNNQVYAIQFWQKAPSDWESKWNEQMKENIIQGFKIK